MKIEKTIIRINSNTQQKLWLVIVLVGVGISQSFAQYEIKTHTINTGSGSLKGGGFEIKASIAQVDGHNSTGSNEYILNPGFWQQNTDLIFKNNFE